MSNLPLDQLAARAPLLFDDFKFSTIGQQPQLLKRISMPVQNLSYNGLRSPVPSATSLKGFSSKSRSKLPFVEDLENENPVADTTLSDGTNEILAIRPQEQPSVPVHHPPEADDRSPQLPSANQLDYTRSGSASLSHTTALSQARKSSIPGSSPNFQTVSVSASAKEQALMDLDAFQSNETSSLESPLMIIRDLHARLLLSLADLHPPNITNALIIAQNANSHATNALSEAQRTYTLAQQSLSSAKDAVAASRECLRAAEQAKADASDAVAAVDHLGSGNRGSGSNEGGQWRSVIIRLQDDLRALGEWVRERESEEISREHDMDKREKNSVYRPIAENAVSSTMQARRSSFRETQSGETSVNVRNGGNTKPIQSALPGSDIWRSASIEFDAASSAHGPEQDAHTELVPTGLPGATLSEARSWPAKIHPANEKKQNLDRGRQVSAQFRTQDCQPTPLDVLPSAETKRMSEGELHDGNVELTGFQVSERKRIAEESGFQPTPVKNKPPPSMATTIHTSGIPQDGSARDSATAAKRPSISKGGEAHHMNQSNEMREDIAKLIPEASTMMDALKLDEIRKEVAKLIKHGQAEAQEQKLPQASKTQDIAQNGDENVSHTPQILRTISLETEDNFPYPDYPAHLTYPPSSASRMSSTVSEVSTMHLHPIGGDLGNVQIIPGPEVQNDSLQYAKKTNGILPNSTSGLTDIKNPETASISYKNEPISPKLSRGPKERFSTTDNNAHGKNTHKHPTHVSQPSVRHPKEKKKSASSQSRSPLSKKILVSNNSPPSTGWPAIAPDASNSSSEQVQGTTERSPVILNAPGPSNTNTMPEGVSESGRLKSTPNRQDKTEHNVSLVSPQGGDHMHLSSLSTRPTREISEPMSLSPVDRQPPQPPENATTLNTPHAAHMPPPTSPILGKRRYNESPNLDEHNSRRQWLPDDRRETSKYIPREKSTNSTSSTWRPPPGRPNLQSRIVARDYETIRIGNGQSYRPAYAGDSYHPADEVSPRSPTSEYYDDRYTPDSRDGPESYYNRGRGSGRSGFRGRGGHGGSQQLNLEQRISSTKPPALLNRLGSPIRRR